MSYEEIGKQIQQARIDKQLTLAEVARRVGCDRIQLSALEKGKRKNVDYLEMKQIRRVLDIKEDA